MKERFFDLIGNLLYYEDTIATATEEAKKSFPDCPVSYMTQLTRQNPSTALLATQHVISYNVRWHGQKLRMWTSLLTQLVKPFLTPTGATLQTQLQTMPAVRQSRRCQLRRRAVQCVLHGHELGRSTEPQPWCRDRQSSVTAPSI